MPFAVCRWLGRNTPGKRIAVSDIWNLVKRLKPGNPLHELGHTHVCVTEIPVDEFGGTVCNHPLTLHKRGKGSGHSWITTRAVEHMAKFHKETSISRQHVDRATVIHTEKVKQQLSYSASDTASVGEKVISLQNNEKTNAPRNISSTSLTRFKLTPEQRQVSSQAQWYVYSDQRVSKRSFENLYFKKMLQVFLAPILILICFILIEVFCMLP
jgi:hypothetical protein